MMDDRFDDVIKEAADEYNRPPETPREVMWAQIEAVRRERALQRRRFRLVQSRWVRWGVGIAAALAIGIGIGRFSIDDVGEVPLIAVAPPGGDTSVGPEVRAAGFAYRLAATEHLTRADVFLTAFRADPKSSGTDPQFWSSVGELLSSTRLLMDSPAAEDPVFRSLLEDLELVLAQIAQLSYSRGMSEVDLVNEGIERRGLLLKLRSLIPAGPAAGGLRGEV